MFDVSYRKCQIDQDTQWLDISRYLTCDLAEDPVRQARKARRLAAGLDVTDQSTSD
ncbi:hypothetical protein AB0B25_20075 [Nocardia sp. NPDC049190]|uniref:hypothetical protein n=1 Tax=Nocardia sp. NPDC049190 TaxID=3155650 RepID=UPI0033FB558A